MTIDEAIKRHVKLNLDLFSSSTPLQGRVGQLPQTRGRRVEVRLVPRSAWPMGSHDGTVVVHDDKYIVYVVNPPFQEPFPGWSRDDLLRYVVLHEYEHATRGDAFEDDPQRAFRRGTTAAGQLEDQINERSVELAGRARLLAESSRSLPWTVDFRNDTILYAQTHNLPFDLL